MTQQDIATTCCIVGGGPAGMMLGLLLARGDVDVLVLEKHRDFLRDFRGDTIHPSTMEVLHELGLLDRFLARPHQRVETLSAELGHTRVRLADFSHLPTHAKFIAFMPQWDFLDFLAEEARRYPKFRLEMRTEGTDLLKSEGRVVGVRAAGPKATLEIAARLVVGCDGRGSMVRDRTALPLEVIGAPMDVLWFRLSRTPADPPETMGRVGRGHITILINRGSYWQCGFVIAKGAFDDIRRGGLDAFRATVREAVPFDRQRVEEIRSWDQVKLLTVGVDRLKRWCAPGVLCIGDAAHTMSPVGGVGINLAIQDAVAAGNMLAEPLRRREIDVRDLALVQQRREPPTRYTQWLQVEIQKRVISSALSTTGEVSPPLPVRLLDRSPLLRRLAARLIGLGFRPEHVMTPALAAAP